MSDVDTLKAKLAEWNRCLNDRDAHSIAQQIAHMLWRSAFYRSVNESRRFAADGGGGSKIRNKPLHQLIDEGYDRLTALAIRRLLDKGCLAGPTGVYSLFALIRDIEKHAHLITRATMLEARGLVYDFEPIKQRAREDAWAEQERGGGAFVSKDGWADAESWHRNIDKLCAVDAENRHPDDKPDTKRFTRLREDLAQCGRNVNEWANKHVAHAASPESRETLDPEHRSVSLAKFWRAERVIVRAAGFISHYIINGHNLGGVPLSDFDPFDDLNRPFVEPSALAAMEEAWNQHKREIHPCHYWFWDSPLTDESDNWNDSGPIMPIGPADG